MPVAKLSVSLDEELAEVVRAAAAEEGESVSSWMASAATARLRNRLLGHAVVELITESQLTEDELRNALAEARSNAIHTDPSGTHS